jgi:hypothetical protein
MADVADALGISEHVARKHYAKWSVDRQRRLTGVLRAVHGEPQIEATAAPAERKPQGHRLIQ